MSDMSLVKLGWWLFVTSALFFSVAAWRAGDGLAFVGSLAFLAANISFMIPVFRKKK